MCNDHNEIFVKDDKCVHVYDIGGQFLRDIGYGHLRRPYGNSSCKFNTAVNAENVWPLKNF